MTEPIVGIGQVIPGWEEGLLDMCLNEKRILTIPSKKAYGTFVWATRKYIPYLMRMQNLRFSWGWQAHPATLCPHL